MIPVSCIPELCGYHNQILLDTVCPFIKVFLVHTYVHMTSTGCASAFNISSRPSLMSSSDTGRHVEGCVGFHVAKPRCT